MPISKLTASELRLTIDPGTLEFADTSELLEHALPWVGQKRAEIVARSGLGMDQPDYNLAGLCENKYQTCRSPQIRNRYRIKPEFGGDL